MNILREIQRDMAFMGWQGPPESGFTHKRGADGRTIAKAHDATWQADYEEAQARVERLQRLYEREDRNNVAEKRA